MLRFSPVNPITLTSFAWTRDSGRWTFSGCLTIQQCHITISWVFYTSNSDLICSTLQDFLLDAIITWPSWLFKIINTYFKRTDEVVMATSGIFSCSSTPCCYCTVYPTCICCFCAVCVNVIFSFVFGHNGTFEQQRGWLHNGEFHAVKKQHRLLTRAEMKRTETYEL